VIISCKISNCPVYLQIQHKAELKAKLILDSSESDFTNSAEWISPDDNEQTQRIHQHMALYKFYHYYYYYYQYNDENYLVV